MQKIDRGCARSLQPCSLTTSTNQKAGKQSLNCITEGRTLSANDRQRIHRTGRSILVGVFFPELNEDKGLSLCTNQQKGEARPALPYSISCDSLLIFVWHPRRLSTLNRRNGESIGTRVIAGSSSLDLRTRLA